MMHTSNRPIALSAFILVLFAMLGVDRARAAPRSCIFDRYTPISAVPYTDDTILAFGSYDYTRGVQLYVPAQPGLTREWLERNVNGALRAANQAGETEFGAAALRCAVFTPRVPNARATVTSAGGGFWVTVLAGEGRSGAQLWHWAENSFTRVKPKSDVAGR
jgi:hypothetical protein